jgi:hypothetical protein
VFLLAFGEEARRRGLNKTVLLNVIIIPFNRNYISIISASP